MAATRTRSGPKGGLGVLEGSGDIVYKSVQVPIAKRAVTGGVHASPEPGGQPLAALGVDFIWFPGAVSAQWCCSWRHLAPVVHGVGWDGHG